MGEEKAQLFTHFHSCFWMIYDWTCEPMIEWTVAKSMCERVCGLAANYPRRRNPV